MKNMCKEKLKDKILLVYLPKEFGSRGSQLQDSGGNGFSLHHGWWVDQLVLLEVPARDPHGHGGLARRDDHPDPGMSAAPHGSAPGVNHEADQEPGIFFSKTF